MRDCSDAFKAAAFSQQTGECPTVLIKMDHADLEEPIRVNSCGTQLEHDGEEYEAFPFEITLPEDSRENDPRGRLRIDNTDRRIVEAVRAVDGDVPVHFKVVLASDPETVEADFPNFLLTDIGYDAAVVEGVLSVKDFSDRAFCAITFNQTKFPGAQ